MSRAGRATRILRTNGSTMPFVAMSVILLFGTVGVCVDMTRDFQTVHQLQFAAQSAALYGLSMSTDLSGNYSESTAQENIRDAISVSENNDWNQAEYGPSGNEWSKTVSFADEDISFVNNPNSEDSSEYFLQLTARRDGNDSLTHHFLPILHTEMQTALSTNALTNFSTYQTVEVLGQPACRVGAGPMPGSTSSRASELVGFATLPLAISNQQFKLLADPAQTSTTCTVDLMSSTSTTSANVKGCLVNVYSPDSSLSYGSATGDSAVNQLEGLLNYFGAASAQTTLAPGVVERGSELQAFNPEDSTIKDRQTDLAQTLAQLPTNKYYIVPVIANDPTFSGSNTVVGFARLKLISAITYNNGSTAGSASFQLGESICMRNTTTATGYATGGTTTSQKLPAPVYPFTPRTYDSASNGISARPRGVVLAPALSPRTQAQQGNT